MRDSCSAIRAGVSGEEGTAISYRVESSDAVRASARGGAGVAFLVLVFVFVSGLPGGHLPGALAADGWPQFQGGASHAGAATDFVASRVQIGGGRSLSDAIVAGAAVGSDEVFVATRSGTLYALDPTLDRVLWTFPTSGAIFNTPAIGPEAVYVPSRDGTLYALRRADGELLWTAPIGVFGTSHPTLHAGRVYLSSSQRQSLCCFDAATGASVFEKNLGFVSLSTPALSTGGGVVAHNGQKLIGFDPDTGATRYEIPLDGKPNGASATLSDDTLYFAAGGRDATLLAADLATGAIRWRVTVGTGASAPSRAAFRDAGLPAGATFSHARRIAGGARAWDQVARAPSRAAGEPTAPARAPVYYTAGLRVTGGSPALGSDSVFLVTGLPVPELVSIRRSDGAFRWKIPLRCDDEPPVVWSSPVLLGSDAGIVADAEGDIRFFSQTTGAVLSELAIDEPVHGSPAVGEKGIYFSTLAGRLVRLVAAAEPASDATPPLLALVVPASSGERLGSRSPELAVRATDAGSGVDFARVRFVLDGSPVAAGSSEFSGVIRYPVPAPLAAGDHAATVEVFDRAGLGATLGFTFGVPAFEDTAAPVLANPTPPDGFRVVGNPRPVVGFLAADDRSGVDPRSIELRLNGIPVPVGFDAATGIIAYHPAADLPNAGYEAVATAVDRAGNRAALLQWSFVVDVAPSLAEANADHVRVLNLLPDRATVAFRIQPSAIPTLRVSRDATMSNPILVRDTRGRPVSRAALTATGLPAETDLYFTIELATDSGVRVVRDRTGPFLFRTPAAAAASPSRPVSVRVLGRDGLGVAGALVTLTIENTRGARATSLGMLTPATGAAALDLGALRDWGTGRPWFCAAGDRLVVAARADDGRAGSSKVTLDAGTGPIALGDLTVEEELPYTIPLKRGLNLVAFPTRPRVSRTNHDVLGTMQDGAAITRFDVLTQAFQTAAKIVGNVVGDLFFLNARESFFVNAPADAEISYPGAPPDDPEEIALQAGLNPVTFATGSGFPDDRTTGKTSHGLLLETPGATELVRFDPTLGRYRSAFVVDGRAMGENFSVVAGDGYYLRVSVATTLTPEVSPLLPRPVVPAAAPARAAAPRPAFRDLVIANVSDRAATVVVDGGVANAVEWRIGLGPWRTTSLSGGGRYRVAWLSGLPASTHLTVRAEGSATRTARTTSASIRLPYIVFGQVRSVDRVAAPVPILVRRVGDRSDGDPPLLAFPDAEGGFYVNLGDLSSTVEGDGGSVERIELVPFGSDGIPITYTVSGTSPDGPIEVSAP